MKIFLVILQLIIYSHIQIYAQNFLKLELLRIENKLILSENYSIIKIPEEVSKGLGWNSFDSKNPDTFLELMQDIHHIKSHILIQTDFFGNVKYAAVSNNLNQIISKKDIPNFLFEGCLKKLNNGFSNQQENIEQVINCIIERLESCTQK